MSVKKIFMTLIIVVACVMIGAFILNVLMPNVAAQLVNSVEDQLYKSTGLSFDFNNDANKGSNDTSYSGTIADDGSTTGTNGNNVEGFN